MENNWSLAGEALAAATGLFPTEPVTPKQGAEAMALAERASRLVEKFCRFGKFEPFKLQPPVKDFQKAFEALTPMGELEITLFCQDLAQPEVIASWAEAINRGRRYLRAQWPAQIRSTPTGPEWIDPPRSVKNRFAGMVAVANDPVKLLEELCRGAVTPEMVAVVKDAYPEIYARFTQAFEAKLKEAGADGKKCPWLHEKQLRLLFEKPSVELVTFGVEPEEPPQQSSAFNIEFGDLKTRGQSLR